MAVLLIGTLDTKGTEFAYVRDRLIAAGISVIVADAGIVGPPTIVPDITREELYAAAGHKIEVLRTIGDRGVAIAAAANAAAKLALRLHKDGMLSGVLGLGGSAGTVIGTAAMRVLPIGVPKLMVSTLASGNVGPYVGSRDITMMYSVVDIAGVNRISRLILDNAAAAMAGMVNYPLLVSVGTPSPLTPLPKGRGEQEVDRPLIAATMFGVTTPCVEAARIVLETAGYELVVFHATGSGGRTMEGLIRDGHIAGVLDITTTELADELVGGILTAGPDRLTAAAIVGIPQVISLGALDMVNFGPPETVPERFRQRKFYHHNSTVTLMRTTPEENDQLGKEIAQKACAAKGPTAVMLPLRGVSAIDIDGGPFWWPDADAALFQSLRDWSYGVELIEVDAHINDVRFATLAAEKLLAMLR